MPKTADAGFDRDFGYLFPFIDKLSAAAKALPQGPARTRLEQLLSEEPARWNEIRALLAGKAPAVAPKSAPRPAPIKPEAAPSRVVGPNQGLTVGSLRPRE